VLTSHLGSLVAAASKTSAATDKPKPGLQLAAASERAVAQLDALLRLMASAHLEHPSLLVRCAGVTALHVVLLPVVITEVSQLQTALFCHYTLIPLRVQKMEHAKADALATAFAPSLVAVLTPPPSTRVHTSDAMFWACQDVVRLVAEAAWLSRIC
jgi:hypothetical protein